MTSAPRIDRYSAPGEYESHRQKVTGALGRRFPRLDPDERLELYSLEALARDTRITVKELGLSVSEQLV